MRAPDGVAAGALGPLRYAWICGVGHVRERNEDSVGLVDLGPTRLLAVVADGMGGHEGGEEAACLAVATLRGGAPDRLTGPLGVGLFDGLLSALLEADEAVKALATRQDRNPGCTIVAALVDADGWCLHLHAGDCRLYHFRGGALQYRTSDHSVAELAYEEGRITEEEMLGHPGASAVLSCLGGDRRSQPEFDPKWADDRALFEQPAVREVTASDLLLLCSDGLSGVVPRTEIEWAIREHGPSLAGLVSDLQGRVLARGAPDNYSILAIGREGG